ncbi:hypothetical protein [Actinoplanes utahensis]|uniref:RanBP2-type domain-containing protein n=1 Tax=Actinoplanes utahensis TaxID=1869 RepID=A0A0A6UQB4_ACTUT|nr:hypothetical protein [Actinoplanes utahensis]KHD76574.1 hypothetical protein MB27_16355 [Actinoplanes utahensis]GIF31259.1 hypothetical protein Aut01nite_42450 [Actinoplanes utahensis]
MWICVNCGERNSGVPDDCRACERPSRESRAVEIWLPEPVWIPEPAEPVPAGDESRSRIMPALPIVVLIGALAVAAVFGGPRLFGARTEPVAAPVTAPGATSAGPVLENVPILEGDGIGLVTVDPAVRDPRAKDVAAMLDIYFTGINERDYRAVAGVLDPAGELDPGVPGQLAAFAQGTSTTRDSEIVLHRLTTAASGRLRAEVNFRSRQKAGHGPPERPDETCTRWRVVYILSTSGGDYRMVRGDGTNEPC